MSVLGRHGQEDVQEFKADLDHRVSLKPAGLQSEIKSEGDRKK